MRSFKVHVRHSPLSTLSCYFVRREEVFKHKFLHINIFFFPDTNDSSYEKICEGAWLLGRKALLAGKFLPRTQRRLERLFQDEAAEEFLDLNPYQHHCEKLISPII
jgi:hypothetical protein